VTRSAAPPPGGPGHSWGCRWGWGLGGGDTTSQAGKHRGTGTREAGERGWRVCLLCYPMPVDAARQDPSRSGPHSPEPQALTHPLT
jgi:hypothetical protein